MRHTDVADIMVNAFNSTRDVYFDWQNEFKLVFYSSPRVNCSLESNHSTKCDAKARQLGFIRNHVVNDRVIFTNPSIVPQRAKSWSCGNSIHAKGQEWAHKLWGPASAYPYKPSQSHSQNRPWVVPFLMDRWWNPRNPDVNRRRGFTKAHLFDKVPQGLPGIAVRTQKCKTVGPQSFLNVYYGWETRKFWLVLVRRPPLQ